MVLSPTYWRIGWLTTEEEDMAVSAGVPTAVTVVVAMADTGVVPTVATGVAIAREGVTTWEDSVTDVPS